MRDMVRSMRPAGGGKPYAVRFETLPGQQAQVDFVQFQVRFAVTPDRVQVVWLFSLVLGFSRLIWGVRAASDDAERAGLPSSCVRGDRWRAARDPLRSHENGSDRRG